MPATILSVFSPYGPIYSARVLTHKNYGFINFERLDDAVCARKALNGRDVLGSDIGAIHIGFAKGISTIPADQQVLGGQVENYCSNLLLSMIGSGMHNIVHCLAFTEFCPPTMYYTMIPLVFERPNNRRWDASKLRELWKRLDSGTMTMEETDQVAGDFLDGEIIDLASDSLKVASMHLA
ncbi:hypothetical protein P692DRAFT_20936461 [Suillus brevipes Sb2]|nr:hypothetical protein P692DRAFT_20936461 [Suillus brevipes Sb2]